MVISASSTLASTDVEQIRTLAEEQWVRAGLARDWDAALSLCAADIVYMPPDQPALHGQWELRQWFDAFPRILEFAQTIESIHGQAHMATCRYSFTATVDAGGRVRNTGKGLASLEKDTLGLWRVKAVCFNWDQPMTAA